MTISKNSLVTLDYSFTDSKGERLNPENEPLIYLHGGYGIVFAKIEAALEGKSVGESVRVELSPSEAFGEFDEELVVEEALSELPDDLGLGMEIDGCLDESPDDIIVYTVKEIGEETAVLDGNHPLAGQSLVFEGTVTDIQEAGEEAVREILEHHRH